MTCRRRPKRTTKIPRVTFTVIANFSPEQCLPWATCRAQLYNSQGSCHLSRAESSATHLKGHVPESSRLTFLHLRGVSEVRNLNWRCETTSEEVGKCCRGNAAGVKARRPPMWPRVYFKWNLEGRAPESGEPHQSE